MPELPQNSSNPQFSDPLLNRFFESPAEKESKKNGARILKAFWNNQTSNQTNLNFFLGRKVKWNELLLWAKGSQPMQEFLNLINVSDGNKSYVNVDMTPQRIAAQFMGTLIESMSKHKTYPSVKAIDEDSLSEKRQRQWDALYRMYDKDYVNNLTQEVGINFEPPNAYVPDDEISARVYFELEDQLPKEIRFEQMLAKVNALCKYERVLSRKGISDLCILNAEFLKLEKCGDKKYTVRKGTPTNMIYNFFMNDTGEQELDMIGEVYNMKVKDIRRLVGKTEERPAGLTEKEIFDLAKTSVTNKNVGVFNYVWDATWQYNTYDAIRPYDDASILVLDTEINCGEDLYYVSKKDAYGRENIEQKKNIPFQQKKKDGTIINQEKPEDVEITKKKRTTWMRGIYAPYGDKLIYWGKPDVEIPDYSNPYKCHSSWSVNIPNNDGDYVPSLFERGMENLREYTVTKLKRKVLISQVKSSGVTIDIESARNTDLGNGDTIAWEEVVRIYNQTGNVVWSSKGIDPNEKMNPPISVGVADDTIRKIIELSNVLAGIVGDLRQLWGVPQYRDGSDVGDRTSGVLQEQQSLASFNVTDFILNGHNQVWEEAYYKLCLLHWNDIVKTEPESAQDMLNTRFCVNVEIKSTEYQKQLLEQDITRYSQMVDAQGNPALTPKDAMMLREIDNAKLARWYLVSVMEKNKREYQERSEQLQSQNAEVQKQSMLAAEEEKRKTLQDELLVKSKTADAEGREKKQQIFLEKIGQMREKGVVPPDNWLKVEEQILQGILMDAFMENKETEAAVDEGIMQAQQEQAMQQQQMQEQELMPQ